MANGHSSTIVNLIQPKVRTNYFKKGETTDHPDIFDPAFVESENDFLNVIRFFKTSEITNTVFYQFVPAGNLAYKEKLILQFSLTKQYAVYFPLLTGLFGFGRISGLRLSTNTHGKSFEVEISSGRTENVLPYFKNIFSELSKEIAFKSALKNAIVVQQEAKKIQQKSLDALYATLK